MKASALRPRTWIRSSAVPRLVRQGHRLGLAIVHRIVTDYGGGIEVRPRSAGGTVFRVSFPERADMDVERQAS
jgi:signal transduction histidine kinase